VSPAKSTKPFIAYIRQSRAKEDTISIEDQRRAIQLVAKSHSITLGEEIVEQGVSGNKAWRERELGRAIALCQEGKAAGIVVFDQDRLSREDLLGTAEVWDAVEKAKAQLYDRSGPVNRLNYVIKAEMARQQWERYKLNWENARRSAVERGKHLGAFPPAGYDKDAEKRLVPNEHAPAIKQAFELRARGAALNEVAALLTESGAVFWSVEAGALIERTDWTLSGVKQMLANEVYLGVIKSRETTKTPEFINPSAHPPLVSRALWEKVRGARSATRSTGNGVRSEGSLLAGLVVCGTCGATMTNDGSRYRCNKRGRGMGCTQRAIIRRTLIEPVVERAVLDHLGTVEYTKSETDPEGASLEAAVADAEAEVAAYLQHVRPTTPGFADGLAKLEAEVTVAREALAEVGTEGVFTILSEGRVEEIFTDEMTPAHRRRVVTACVRSVTVQPGHGPATERVAIELRPVAGTTPIAA
jgi:DNA invertase Pin-like site-specific DNA recombinase